MRAQELRIGNYVEYFLIDTMLPEDKWEWVAVDVEVEDLKIIDDEDLFRSIQITEEWLLKLGFQERTGFHDDLEKCFEIEFEYLSYSVIYKENVWMFGYEYQDYNIEIKFIHELQNLIFALCKEEITLKK